MKNDSTSFALTRFQAFAVNMLFFIGERLALSEVYCFHGKKEMWFQSKMTSSNMNFFINSDSFEIHANGKEIVWEIYDFESEAGLREKFESELKSLIDSIE